MSNSELEKLPELTAVLGGKYAREFEWVQAFIDHHTGLLPFAVGDHVALSDEVASIDFVKSYGWAPNSRILRPGNTGTITGLSFSQFQRRWLFSFQFDVEWSVSLGARRCFGRTPDKRHVFVMLERDLRALAPGDTSILPEYDDDTRYHLADREVTYFEFLNAVMQEAA